MKKPIWPLAALLGVSLPAAAVQADTAVSPQAAAAQLSEVLSLVSGGWLGTAEHPVEVARDGDAFSIRVPLPALAEPPRAAMTARAQPLANGVWDLTSAAVPSQGVFTMASPPGAAAGQIAYTIGQQNISARVDPMLSRPSPFHVELRDLALWSKTGDQTSEQTIARNTLDGVLSGDSEHRITIRSQTTASDWRISTRDRNGVVRDSLIHSAAGSLELEGVDRGKADRLRLALQALFGTLQPAGSGATKANDLTPAQRAQIEAILDGMAGALNRIAVEQTVEGLTIGGPDDVAGEIRRMRVGLAGESRNDHLSGSIDLTLHDLKVAAVPADFASYLPTLLQLRPVVSGIRTTALLRFLHHAAAGAAPDALTAEAMTLLNEPGARLGIENLSVTAGPLRLEGSGRMLPPSGGLPGLEAHILARGVDATIASAQGNPEIQKIMPLIFLAKGMARPQGDALIWDVAFIGGTVTVNGTPLNQPGPSRPSQPQQPKRPHP
ncbi:MAG: hypothetical protein ACJ8AI_09355 [Rhodopila sp.]